jgi:DNA-binding response OmpR family regulator
MERRESGPGQSSNEKQSDCAGGAMGKSRLLVVEDDVDISNMLQGYFSGLDFDVEVAHRGAEALEKTRHGLPDLIVLDILLPDIDGYEVCRSLRQSTRTSHIPVIFLTQKDERVDRLQGLELGADDYITKPFDIEELRLRVVGAIRRAERESLTDPRSGLPAGRLIEEQLRRIIRSDGWTLLDIRINHLDAFREVYGFVAGDNVLRFTAMLLRDAVTGLGSSDDFLGQAGSDDFILITSVPAAGQIRQRIKERFAAEIPAHYNFVDRGRGFIEAPGPGGATEHIPLMTLSVGAVSAGTQPFADIREISEAAAEARRVDSLGAAQS